MRLKKAAVLLTVIALLISNAQQNPNLKMLIFNEIKVSGEKFIEFISPYPKLLLDGLYVAVLEYGKDHRHKELNRHLALRAIASLRGLKLKDQLGWIGKTFYLTSTLSVHYINF